MIDPTLYQVFREALIGQIADQYPECIAHESDRSPLYTQAARLAHGGSLPANSHQGFADLESIFNHINKQSKTDLVAGTSFGRYNGTCAKSTVSLQAIKDYWQKEVSGLPNQPSYANALLELTEDAFSAVPADRDKNVRHDISMFHHAKTTAALACCLKMSENQETDKPFVLYALDFSGIQKFIYTITSSGALKGLRSRSLYLSLMMDYIADEILDLWGLSRANLIYAGGGKAYLLLSNVLPLLERTEQYMDYVNKYLREKYGTALYLASAYVPVDGNDLTSGNGQTNAFSEMFRRLSRIISERKLSRYTAAQILELNCRKNVEHDKECAICGTDSHLHRWKELDLCDTCMRLEKFAATLQPSNNVFSISTAESDQVLPLPSASGDVYWLRSTHDKEIGKAVRVYGINQSLRSVPCSVRIAISQHRALNANDEFATFADLAENSRGIQRLGVFRCDVDNLGALFANGFIQDGAYPWQAYNLSRYSALSSAMTWFFQAHIDNVLESPGDDPLLQAANAARNVAVVYAGGDDVFLLGSWNDVLSAGLKLQKAFTEYTSGTVSLSGGFCLFPEHIPVTVMAEDTANMESAAKGLPDGKKNGVALFGKTYDTAEGYIPRWHWDDFRSNVLNKKLSLLADTFSSLPDKGNSFLYHVLELFREIERNPVAVARLAYLLARHMPNTAAAKEKYKVFMKQVYAWALPSDATGKQAHDDNRAFRTACQIYVYLNRETTV